jgi:hydroxymethylpyrimidine/phosphomethylpyrimidine kinase
MNDYGGEQSKPCVLAIAGLDPSGGAGLPADARAIAAFGAHACGIATAVIAQNTKGVSRFEAVTPDMLRAQLDNLLEDVTPSAVKIGMLPTVESVTVVVERLRRLKHVPIIVDPVFAPSSGPAFSVASTISALLDQLLPLAEMVTPNIPEAEKILGITIPDLQAMREAAMAIGERYGSRFVLLKGGHLTEEAAGESGDENDEESVVDVLFDSSSHTLTPLRMARIGGYEVRGTGRMLASAIAAQRARGVAVPDATWRAKAWLATQMSHAVVIGGGRRVASG